MDEREQRQRIERKRRRLARRMLALTEMERSLGLRAAYEAQDAAVQLGRAREHWGPGVREVEA
jgi:hypothetical protein